jgi:hypothetical protein
MEDEAAQLWREANGCQCDHGANAAEEDEA